FARWLQNDGAEEAVGARAGRIAAVRDVSPLIRVANPEDAPRIAEIYAPAVLEHVTSFELVAPDANEMVARITRVLERYPWLACELDGRVIGYAYASMHSDRAAYRWSANVAVYVSGDVHRRGVGTALYASLFEILALQRLRNVYAGITMPNAASEWMHGRAGFKLVGMYHHVGYKFGAWHDVAWLERAILALVINPPEPLSFPEIRDTPPVAAAMAKGQALLRRR
ncbi:MAG: N-acetyltransferase family protein, partial [Gemmatimonadaceae bacterium]